MNLNQSISVYAGGPGSGCKGDTCGRPRKDVGPYKLQKVSMEDIAAAPVKLASKKMEQERAGVNSGNPVAAMQVIATPGEAKAYWLFDGSRRYQAMKEKGVKQVQVAVVSGWKNKKFATELSKKIGNKADRWKALPQVIKDYMLTTGYRNVQAGGPGSGRYPKGSHQATPGAPSTEGYVKSDHLTDLLKNLSTWEHGHGGGLWGLIYHAGHPGVRAPLTPQEQKIVDDAIKMAGNKCKVGQCYMNAQQLVMNDSSNTLKYIEGLVTVHGVPIAHAWNEINGKIVDVSLTGRTAQVVGGKHKYENSEYYGVEIPKVKIAQHALFKGTYSPITETWNDPRFAQSVFKKYLPQTGPRKKS